MKKIAFLAANCRHSYTNQADWYLRAYCADMDWDWHTVELTVGQEPYPAFSRIAELKPDVLAVSFYVFNTAAVLSLINRYKRLNPDCVVIAGGPQFLGDNRVFLGRERDIDVAIRGEGEIPFRQILESINTKDAWTNIQGICGFFDNEYVDNGTAECAESLDDIPSPFQFGMRNAECGTPETENSAMEGERPREPQAPWKSKPFLQVESSRGCRNSCGFCVSGAQSVRYLSTDRLRSDLTAIRNAGIHGVRMVDRTFNDKPSRCIELLQMFRIEFPEMHFHLEIEPAQVTDEILAELAAARASDTEEGCEVSRYGTGKPHLDVGVQSFSEEVMAACGRRSPMERTVAGLTALCDMDAVEVHADLIAGLPGQTLEQVFSDVRKLVSIRPMEIQLELLKLLPGTQLDASRNSYGLIASPEPPYEVLSTGDMGPEELGQALWLSKLLDWFYEPKAMREIICLANVEVAGFWEKLVDYCAVDRKRWMKPSLENRFRYLKSFFESEPSANSGNMVNALQYQWMKHGFSGPDVCECRPWKQAVSEDAQLIEGNPGAHIESAQSTSLDREYLFVYDSYRNKGAAAVYLLG